MKGLAADHPLVRFFAPGGEALANYRALDDTVMWGAMHCIHASGEGELQAMARRILNREKPICLDIQNLFPENAEKQRRLMRRLNDIFRDNIGRRIFRDTARLSIYGEVGGQLYT
ncbi:MAG: hypothetical protein ABL996_25895 [Micropepsaceae bacterium]